MKNLKKSQFAVEFVILISVMFIIFVGFFAIVSYRLNEVREQEKQDRVEAIGKLIFDEISLAKSVNDGYNRTLKLPRRLGGFIYNVSLIDNREIVVTLEDYEHVLFLQGNIIGDIKTGLNTISKKNGIVYLTQVDESACSNEIDDDNDGYVDVLDAGCYVDCDYLDYSGYDSERSESDTCSCNNVGSCCISGGNGTHYSYYDGDCVGECWTSCIINGNLLFILKNSIQNVMSFDDIGKAVIRGTLSTGEIPTVSSDDEFIIKDSNGDNVAIVNLVTGNMAIAGSLYENQNSLTPAGNNDFIIKNATGEIVSYIDELGNFYLANSLSQEGNP